MKQQRLAGGEYTVLCGAEGAEKKLRGFADLGKARAVAAELLAAGLTTRVVIARPSGNVDEPDFYEVSLRGEP